MKLVITPGGPLRGRVQLPGDKSLSHRAVLLGAMADGESQIENFLVSGVTRAMLRGLDALGIAWEHSGSRLTIHGRPPSAWKTPEDPILCGNSATTIRLLAGALAASGVEAVLDGSEGLRKRPMGRIVDPLRRMGVEIHSSDGGTAPLKLIRRGPGSTLRAIQVQLPIASAQVKSCLLLAALAADGPSTIIEPGPSRDHTERMLRGRGIQVEQAVLDSDSNSQAPAYQTRIFPPKEIRFPALKLRLPGDISSGAFLLSAAIITPGSEVTLEQVCINPTRTGLIEAFQSMGAFIEVTPTGEAGGESVGDVTARYSPRIQGTRVFGPLVVRMIDEFPAFAVAAAFAKGDTIVTGAEELRTKESDRIDSICTELARLGADIQAQADGFTIRAHGDRLQGGRVNPHGDHRLAMSLATVGLAAQGPVVVEDGEVISESFPDFAQVVTSLGGNVHSEE